MFNYCRYVFSEAPILKNELINKVSPLEVQILGLRQLCYSIIKKENEQDLGMKDTQQSGVYMNH